MELSLLFLLLLATLGYAMPSNKTKTRQELRAMWADVQDACKAELKLQDEEIVAIRTTGAILEKNAKCYQFCLGSKLMGEWKTKEEWEEKVRSMLAQTAEHVKEDVLQIFQMCKDKSGTDECDRVNQVSQCCREEGKKVNT